MGYKYADDDATAIKQLERNNAELRSAASELQDIKAQQDALSAGYRRWKREEKTWRTSQAECDRRYDEYEREFDRLQRRFDWLKARAREL